MTQVPDRKKLRREYLRKKRRLNTVQIVGFMILLPSILMPISAIIIALILFRANFTPLYVLATLAGLTLWLFLVRWGWRALMEVERKERTLPYVPPMTPNTLPANEVLVRAAAQPETPHSDVLLRAARGGETPSVELLRATTAEESEE